MGQTCCSADSSDIDSNIDTARPERKIRDDSVVSDSEPTLDALNTEEQVISSQTPRPEHSTADQEMANMAFIEAIKSGNDVEAMTLVQEYEELDLLQMSFDIEEDNIQDGDNCLHVAVRNKSYKLIVFLLNSGVSPSDQNLNNGDSALHTAVRTREVNIVTLLFKNNADPNITNDEEETPMTIATRNNDEDIIELLSPDTQQLIKQGSAPGTAATSDVLADLDDVKVADADNRSRYGSLQRDVTKKALDAMQNIDDAKDTLPELAAWLEKKQSTMPYSYQKRWVMVKGSYILWSDIKRDIKDPKNIKERKKFNNALNIMSISEVKPITKGRTQRKWVMIVGDKKKREYVWKCATESDRNAWVGALQKHIEHQKSVIVFLGAK